MAWTGWRVVALLSGPGVASPKSRPQGVEPATLAKSRPVCPPGPVWSASCVDEELAVDGVADAALERATRFFAGLALGELLLEEDAARGVVRDLRDRCDVQGVVEVAVPTGVEPMPDLRSRGRRDRSGGVVAGVVPGGREPADVTGVADDRTRP